MVKYKDYYKVLGVPRTATDKEIKAAYRKLARQHHPDANKGNKASEEKFKELNEAYEALKDPEKRKRYDMLGSGWKEGADFKPPPDFNFAFDFGDFGKGAAFSDFFEVLFGQTFGQPQGGFPKGTSTGGFRPGQQGGPARSQSQQQAKKTSLDLEASIELSVEELAKGATRTLQISMQGTPSKTIDVKIPPGVRAGSNVRVAGKGATRGGETGNLILRVKVKPHDYFTIDGEHLACELPISPAKAVLGGDSTVTTVDGPVTIKVPAGTQNGRVLRLRGKGLPNLKDQNRGDQLVRTRIVVPAEPTDEEKKLYEQLAKIEKKQH